MRLFELSNFYSKAPLSVWSSTLTLIQVFVLCCFKVCLSLLFSNCSHIAINVTTGVPELRHDSDWWESWSYLKRHQRQDVILYKNNFGTPAVFETGRKWGRSPVRGVLKKPAETLKMDHARHQWMNKDRVESAILCMYQSLLKSNVISWDPVNESSTFGGNDVRLLFFIIRKCTIINANLKLINVIQSTFVSVDT